MKYCRAFPCDCLADPGSAYCEAHKPARTPKETDPFYLSVAWRRFRAWYIANHPLCELCLEDNDRAEKAVIVDHVLELKDGGKPLDESNVQALCRLCHARKTSNEAARRNRTNVYKNHQEPYGNNRLVTEREIY